MVDGMLALGNDHFRHIRTLGLSGRPNEVCGLLAGTATATRDGRRLLSVTSVYPVDNVDRSPVSFRMDPAQQFQAEKAIEQEGLKVIGVFHTHPTSEAYPSDTDIARAHWEGSDDLLFPDTIFLILSIQNEARPDLRAFEIQGRRAPDDVHEVPVILSAITEVAQ